MKLSIQQKNAIDHVYGPALVLAVPGAGKTTVLVHRTYNLIKNHGIDPNKILSITFSKASAIDMKKRFTKFFPNISNEIAKFSTIHAFCFSLIREYAYTKRIRYRLIENEKDQFNKYNILKKIYYQLNRDYITEEKLDNLLNYIGYINNTMMDVDNFLKKNKTDIDSFKDIYIGYESYKRNNNLLDFDDMLTISLAILKNNRYLLEKYRDKYNFIQVDEGQDTSLVQMEIIKLLAYPKNNILIVADDDQSIYGFRGAYPQGLLNFNRQYENGKIFFMEQNYRSSKNIVSVCNNFIKSNNIRYEKNIFTDNSHVEPINIIKVNSIDEQYRYIIEDIKGKDLSQCCILYRNNISAIGIIETLEKNNISFYMRDKKIRFFNHWVIKDILSFMMFAEDTSQMSLYENFYYKIRGYISKNHINYAKTLDSSISVFDRIMKYPGNNSFYLRTISELKLDFKKISNLKPEDAILYIEHSLEYDEYLRENSIKFGYTYDNLSTMLFYLKMIAKSCDNLRELIGRLNYIQNLCMNSQNNRDTITLSTIHSAKGLEFDRVYIIDLIDGDFPGISSIEAYDKGDISLLEEERRLFYVGMSRAKTHLSLITMNTVNEKRHKPSRFLIELDNSLQ
ncbi:MAG: ATP-dependent helicase [Tissierellaceae bacterium]